MKKLVTAMIAALALTALFVTPAFADGGGPKGPKVKVEIEHAAVGNAARLFNAPIGQLQFSYQRFGKNTLSQQAGQYNTAGQSIATVSSSCCKLNVEIEIEHALVGNKVEATNGGICQVQIAGQNGGFPLLVHTTGGGRGGGGGSSSIEQLAVQDNLTVQQIATVDLGVGQNDNGDENND